MLEGLFGYINPRFSTENSGQTCRLQSQIALVVISAMPLQFSSVQFSCSIMSNSLHSHGLQHARPPCPSPTPGIYSNSCPLSWWCHPTTSSSVVPASSLLQTFPASGFFQMSRISSSHQVTKVLGFQLQYQSFQWIFRTDFL